MIYYNSISIHSIIFICSTTLTKQSVRDNEAMQEANEDYDGAPNQQEEEVSDDESLPGTLEDLLGSGEDLPGSGDLAKWIFPISQELMQHGKAEMERIIEMLHLAGEGPIRVIQGQNKNCLESIHASTDTNTETTIERYRGIWKQLVQFCIIVGDYESAIIFDQTRPGYIGTCQNIATAASRDTCFHFLRFMVFESKAPLNHMLYGTPILDVNGQPIACLGTWCGQSTLKLAQSAIAKVHHHYENLGSVYTDFCINCRNEACNMHGTSPQLLRKGCPITSPIWKKAFKGLLAYVKSHNKKRATVALLPGQLRQICNFCINQGEGSNGKFFLMVWTVIIVGIKQLLRISEVLNKTIENFETDLQNLSSTNVIALVDSVLGKTDQEKVFLMLWDDEDCPEFSPTRAIFLWLKVSGIKSGYLFPSRQALLANNSAPTEPLSYDGFLYELKSLYVNVLQRPTNLTSIVGTHVLRKTGYLIAVWGTHLRNAMRCPASVTHDLGPIDSINILLSARHSTSSDCASFYIQDASTMWRQAHSDATQKEKNKVSQFREIHIARNADNYRSLNDHSIRFQRPIVELADYYIHDLVHIQRGSSNTIHAMHQMICKFSPHRPLVPEGDPDLLNALKSVVPIDRWDYVENLVQNHNRFLHSQNDMNTNENESEIAVGDTFVEPTTNDSLAAKKKLKKKPC